ncbi:MAG: response regulator [Defluviitaleaceae bacterium]|nr:response regulator [Defluviitaleaceae bacterium]
MITIFIVDDNDVNLITAEKALGDFYNVYTLPSAEAMFELMEEITPELILLDIKMPEMDGFEAIKILKSDPKYISIPVIFLTGKNDSDTEKIAFEAGAVGFVTKPFDPGELFRKIMLCTQ